MSHYKLIEPQNLQHLDPKTSTILDVRTPIEHAEKRLKMEHQHAPLDELDPELFLQQCGLDENSNIYILCGGGGRARRAADKFLEKQSCKNVFVIEGGLRACEALGIGVEGYESPAAFCLSTKTPISLERQVRIAAGAIAFSGAFLALTASSAFALIPLFVGGGLVFAGITNWCGMALLLAKAPWNKIKK